MLLMGRLARLAVILGVIALGVTAKAADVKGSPESTLESSRSIPRYEVFEARLESALDYSNPFADVTVTAEFTAPSGRRLTAHGFYDGGKTWRVRLAPDEVGQWSYVTACSDTGNSGLHNRGERFKCAPSTNKGFIRPDRTRKYWFSFDDGTPFFGMGDTCYGMVNGISDSQRIAYLNTRAFQQFNFIRFFASGYPCRPDYPVAEADAWPWGGTPSEPDYDRLNPRYFQRLESILGELKARGMYAEIEVLNYYSQPFHVAKVWTAKREDLWSRYVVSRLAADTTVFLWTVTNEYEIYPNNKYAYSPEEDDSWVRRMGALFHAADPHKHPTTAHPWERTIMVFHRFMGPRFGNSPEIDVLTQQHYGWFDFVRKTQTHDRPPRSMSEGLDVDLWADRVYNKPVINTETGYESEQRTDKCRSAAWRLLMGGGAAYAAGFGSTWNGRHASDRPFVVKDYGLAKQLGHFYDFIMRTDFREMAPTQDVVYRAKLNNYQVNTPNICLANPGREYAVYAADGGTVTLELTSVSGNFEAEWLNPRSGEYRKLPNVAGGARRSFEAPDSNDWVLHLKASKAESIAAQQKAPKLVAVLIEGKLKPEIQPALDQYQNDLEKEGYAVRQFAVLPSDDPHKLRALLQSQLGDGLDGAVLVGDIPAILFNSKSQEGHPYWHDHLCDAYYADLDGQWNDSNHNGTYDEHKGAIGAEIWVSRLKPNNPSLGRPAADLLRDYFARNHAFRTGTLERPPRRAFVAWHTMDILRSTHFAARPSVVYGDKVEIIGGYELPGTAEKAREFLADPRGYELGIINCATFATIHHFDPPNSPKDPKPTTVAAIQRGKIDHGVYDITSTWVAKTKPKTLFYHMLTSEPGRHDQADYLCGTYLFAADALTMIAGAQHSGAVGTPNVYHDLAAGKSFGDAWRNGLNYGAAHAGERHVEYVCWRPVPEEGVWSLEEA